MDTNDREGAVGFTGTREQPTDAQLVRLETILNTEWCRWIDEFHHGCCEGADEAAAKMAKKMGFKVIGHPPINKIAVMRDMSINDELRKPYDYLTRNRHIVKETNALIAVSKTMKETLRSGTWSTIRQARKIKRDVVIIYPDGTYDGYER